GRREARFWRNQSALPCPIQPLALGTSRAARRVRAPDHGRADRGLCDAPRGLRRPPRRAWPSTRRSVSRRANAAYRCTRCRMHASLCVCALIPSPRLDTRTRLVLFIHREEDKKSTNTGRLATECLANSEVFVRGHRARPSEPFTWEEASQPVLLFPH